jgi:tetratricopeptide (TPR) repeat protein
MGRGGPLDHPELLEVQKLLDDRNVAEAQRLLGRIGNRAEFSHGIAFLTTRLLHARGRLDLRGVAERLRELLSAAPGFEEALALLAEAEAATSVPPGSPTQRKSPPTPVVPPESEGARPPAPRTPRVPQSDREREGGTQTVRSSPRAPAPEATGRGSAAPRSSSKPASKRRGKSGRTFTPVKGFSAREQLDPPDPPRGVSARGSPIPDIPRAPGLPQFRDNRAPPSYAPRPDYVEPEILRGKSLLPENAGRYSEKPAASMDVVDPARRRRSRAPRNPSAAGGQRQHGEPVPETPERIRSASPPKNAAPLPTLFEIASWIDEGRFRDAVAAINRAGASAGPEYAVLRARALAGAGYADQALQLLEEIDRRPSLEPELRAATARLFVELGDPGRALEIARQALDADPERPLIRLTYALAAVRTYRTNHDTALLGRAEAALEKFAAREGPLPALYLALRASIQAGSGDPQRAISMAQRALGLDGKSADALAAIAEASARLGRVHDARQAWSKLAEASPADGEVVAALLSHARTASGAAMVAAKDAPPLWTPVDLQLAGGQNIEALRGLERAAQSALRRVTKSVLKEDFTATATVAASFLTTSPVLSSFAPYDASLWSIRRLDAVLGLLAGRDGGGVLSPHDTGLVLLVGCYVGETLRLAYAGRWEGRTADLDGAKIVIAERELYPFRVVAARLHHGRRASLESATQVGAPRPGADPWQARIANPVAPPTPWSPNAWPPPSQIAALGRSLSQSPVARFCEEFAEGPLDRTTASLIALDTYLDLVAPRGAPVDSDGAWTRRVSVLAGGYLGETLRELVGGEWVYGADTADDALGFRLRLRGTTEALPVAQVLERIIGERTSSLVDYARTLMRRAGRA